MKLTKNVSTEAAFATSIPSQEDLEAGQGGELTASFPTSTALLKAVVRFARDLPIDSSDSAVAQRFIGMATTLFPGRNFCLQLLARNPPATVRVTGGTHHAIECGEPLRVPQGCALPNLPERLLGALIQPAGPDFLACAGSHSGFHVPLANADTAFGILSVEYSGALRRSALDESLMLPLCEQLTTTLHHVHAHRRSLHEHKYLEHLLEHANAPFVLTDRNGRVAFVNAAYCSATGFSPEDAIGQELGNTLSPGTSERLIRPLLSALRGEATADTELCLKKNGGGEVHVTANCAAVRDAQGTIDGALLIYRDISELRQLQAQVIQSEKLATLGQMAAGVVHELNNPLTSISAYAEYLTAKYSDRSGAEADVKKLRSIAESAQRIQRFNQDLIAYARPSDQVPRRTSVGGNLQRALGFCEHLVTQRDVTVDLSIEDGMPELFAVSEQLIQVWVNLITNACHAMEAGRGRLSISAAENAGEVLVTVADNGHGIPPTARQQLFEPFFTTKSPGEGTGLGLSIVKSIVERHCGRIALHSTEGRGTRFEVTLPCRPNSAPPGGPTSGKRSS